MLDTYFARARAQFYGTPDAHELRAFENEILDLPPSAIVTLRAAAQFVLENTAPGPASSDARAGAAKILGILDY